MTFSMRGAAASLTLLLVPAQLFAAGSLTVTQSGVTGGSVPKGAQRVPFLVLTLEAGCGAPAVVRELTIAHDGLGDSADLERVYASDGRRRLTRGRSFGASDRTATLRFIPALDIPACAKKSLTIVADLSLDAASAGEHRLRVASPSDVDTDADVRFAATASRPSHVATVRPASVGSVSVTFLDLTTPLRFGTSRTLARVRLEAGREADQEIRAITLTNDGKATDGDLKNLRIQNRRGQALTNTAATMDGDRVTLTFDPPLRLDRNDEVLLELKGDVVASRRRTVRFVLEEPSDLEAADRAR